MGPFNAGLPVQVPLWMAINLKQGQKCRIIPPDWMETGNIVWSVKIEFDYTLVYNENIVMLIFNDNITLPLCSNAVMLKYISSFRWMKYSNRKERLQKIHLFSRPYISKKKLSYIQIITDPCIKMDKDNHYWSCCMMLKSLF